MSWECPHQTGDESTCERRGLPCKPLESGCVLCGKVTFVGIEEKERSMKTPNDSLTPRANIQPDQTVAETVLRYPQLREKLEQLGVDYCCGGKRSLADAVQRARLDLAEVVRALEQALDQPRAAATDWTAASVTALAEHILDTHHVFTKAQLPRIAALLAKVQRAHSLHHGAMLAALRSAFEPLRAELEAHLSKEEQILFPAIIAIDGYLAGRNARPQVHCGSVAHPIRQMEFEHDGAGAALARMRELTQDYQLPDDACETFKALYAALSALEVDLHEHIHLENNVLFPASVAQEQRIGAPT
ncbi:MAG TPA: iron-sulfur cluster repair di-iron protein [Kiritimatiellia bacterium]|nr:iron-sulfur cluster repair di-iron protein [Kiritimatiellia bacterium]HPS07841.1 iron-sulfur cluster repair di-iron protein [Kiritimatiellia bacterium]